MKVTEGLKFRDNVYYDDENNDGPFCSGCADSREQRVRLQDRFDTHWFCPACKWTDYKNAEARRRVDEKIQGRDGDDEGSWIRSRY